MDTPVKLNQATAAEPLEQSLYEIRQKIYPRAVTGMFATWRWGFVLLTQLVFYGSPWLTWNGRQAVLFDLASRKFYIFGLVFWPQDIVYLTVLLIISACSLILFTAVAGRLWCGFACPQTVYTEIFMWIERKVEGERLARMKLDKGPLSARKFGLKAIKHGLWIALALWTGFTFVGYFTPIKTLGQEVLALSTGPWESFWILFYGFATYGNAGWMREQVCKYMCPYARFQGVMFDPDTLIITYDRERGEPRGSRSRSDDHKGQRPGRLRRLRHLRAGVPDRHRHPQRTAVRVHRLHRLHRRLQPRDGEDGVSEGPHPVFDRERAQRPLQRRAHGEAGAAAAGADLHRDPVDHHHRGAVHALQPRAAKGGRDPRSRQRDAARTKRRRRTSTDSRS